MVAKLVKSLKIKPESGYIYLINNNGHLYKIPEKALPGKKVKPLLVKKIGIKRKPGYVYFLDKQGDIRKVFLEEGSKFLKKETPKVKKKLKRKG